MRPLRLVLRLWPEQFETDEALDELLGVLTRRRDACDEVWFAVARGFPPLDVHRRFADRMAAAAERVRAVGVLPGIQVGRTVGHADEAQFPADAITWQTLVGHDGRVARTCNCPRAPGFHDYLRDMLTPYAAWGPSSLWLDDDLRMHHHPPVAYGCFCERCLADFSAAAGGAWDREGLVAAFHGPDGGALRLAWTRFNQESIAMVCRTAAEAVHAVAPDCLLGLQTIGHEWGLYDGPDYAPAFAAYASVGGHPIGSRPGHGVYTDHRPRDLINKAFTVARQVARLPEAVTVACPEIENFTHTAMGKTPHGTVVESTLDLALSGCNALSYAIIGLPHEPLSWCEGILDRVGRWRPFWERYRRDGAGTRAAGFEIVFSRDHAARPICDGERPMAWAHLDLAAAQQLTTMGLPLCAENQHPCGALLTAGAADGLTDAEIERLLAGGLLIDGDALARLQARGFGPLIGMTAEPWGRHRAYERFTADPINGPHAGHVWMQPGGRFYRLDALSDGARVLGEYVTQEGDALGAATAAVETAAGGRVGVLGANGFEHVVSSARRAQVLALADWIGGGAMPALVETPAQVMVVPRTDEQGRLSTCLALNVSIDATPPLRTILRGATNAEAVWVTPETADRPLTATAEGDRTVLDLPPLPPWSLGYVALRNTHENGGRS